MIALYFKFNRILSVRNLDLLGLIALAPALLMVQYGRVHANANIEHAGYIWLFAVSGLFLLRLLLDTAMVRRPLLEPNLSVGGLTFLGISLFAFLMANVIVGTPDAADVSGSERAADLVGRVAPTDELNSLRTHGPGFPLLFVLPQISTQSILGDKGLAGSARGNAWRHTGQFRRVASCRDCPSHGDSFTTGDCDRRGAREHAPFRQC